MSLIQSWKKQVWQSPLVRVMRIYWKVFYNEEHYTIGRRWEPIAFLERILKKRWPRRHFPIKIWFYCVKSRGMFDPFVFVDDEKYLETLSLWKERKMAEFLDKYPQAVGYRHEKVCRFKKPIRG